MAGYRPYGYEYETSPKKLQPEYEKKTNPYKKKKSTSKKVNKNTSKAKTKRKSKYNVKPVLYIILGFVMLFTISYRNSLINESYNKKESLKAQASAVEKENEQLKVSIESSLNLNSVEKTAREQLGMQKLGNSQKVYVNLQKKDYVEPTTEQVQIEENASLFEKILNSLTKAVK